MLLVLCFWRLGSSGRRAELFRAPFCQGRAFEAETKYVALEESDSLKTENANPFEYGFEVCKGMGALEHRFLRLYVGFVQMSARFVVLMCFPDRYTKVPNGGGVRSCTLLSCSRLRLAEWLGMKASPGHGASRHTFELLALKLSR